MGSKFDRASLRERGANLPEHINRWLQRRNASQIISEKQLNLANQKAIGLVSKLNDESLALTCAALYWAEGAKKDFSFTNSDPEMIKVFIVCIKRLFNVNNEDVRISIRMYEGMDRGDSIDFWSKIVGFELKNNVSINIVKGRKVGKLKYGMCRVRVKKAGLLLKTLFAINKRVSNIISS